MSKKAPNPMPPVGAMKPPPPPPPPTRKMTAGGFLLNKKEIKEWSDKHSIQDGK